MSRKPPGWFFDSLYRDNRQQKHCNHQIICSTEWPSCSPISLHHQFHYCAAAWLVQCWTRNSNNNVDHLTYAVPYWPTKRLSSSEILPQFHKLFWLGTFCENTIIHKLKVCEIIITSFCGHIYWCQSSMIDMLKNQKYTWQQKHPGLQLD